MSPLLGREHQGGGGEQTVDIRTDALNNYCDPLPQVEDYLTTVYLCDDY